MCVCTVCCHFYAGPIDGIMEPIDIDVGDATGTDGDAGLAVA